ncbi:unnamed protein product [Clavelina lepadiformis]|uniref:Cyclin-dependent kinases regulatory subunit n=1 Tax=Clavelina lepadiformis TaxID=159417 RepID=A0ABP0FIQ3_CLALP
MNRKDCEIRKKEETEKEESLRLIQTQMQKVQSQIIYSMKYSDEEYDYRHVFLPNCLVKMIPHNHLMTESEWRNLGVQQSVGWEHYMIHNPEPHILLFRRRNAADNMQF